MLEIRDIKGRMAHLETELGRHEESIRDLQAQASRPVVVPEAPPKVEFAPQPSPAPKQLSQSRPLTTRQAQIALKRAGHNPGPIDGKMGRLTRSAIRSFQQAEGLQVTGALDSTTSSVLGDHL